MNWEAKAHRIIGQMCRESYVSSNKGRKKHKPYSVPLDAERLIDCLNRNDEETAKAIFIRHAYNLKDY